MEMEMIAGEEIGIGEDITPLLSPLAFSLHDSFLHSHCSSCFSPLPDSPFPPSLTSVSSLSSRATTTTVLYCSPLCASSDSPLHYASSEFHLLHSLPTSTSDLRLALRLLHSLDYRLLCDGEYNRISGLLTNRDKLMEDDEISSRVREGARAMAVPRKLRDGNLEEEEEEEELLWLEEAALCLVRTNAVEVQDSRGCALGIAVYDPSFSWINHSCSPNACYRFVISLPNKTLPFHGESMLRIVPSTSEVKPH